MNFSRRSIVKAWAAGLVGSGLPLSSPNHRRVLATESVKSLWDRTVRPFLGDDQWRDIFSYDAGHVLMVPLHAAFTEDADPEWVVDFGNHVARFVDYARNGPLPENRINRLQYLYLWTQFALLARSGGHHERVPSGLLDLIRDAQASLWSDEPAWQWGRDPFPGGIRERLRWKQETSETPYSYYRSIIDEELFSFAVAADLVTLGAGEEAAIETVDIADTVFEERGKVQADGGWLFDPGVYWDHPDYAYAGHEQAAPGMEKNPVPGIAGDTSHAHRMPRWLQSLANVPGDAARDSMYADALERLNTQFVRKVLVPPSQEFPAYRTTNFMDGRNGLYRWEYETQGANNGYGPFELSGTLSHGWWIFLDSADMRAMYESMGDSFPLPQEVIDLYVGPNTTRERHPLAALPAYYTDGLAEVIARLAAGLRITV